jgi:hypothetical protein
MAKSKAWAAFPHDGKSFDYAGAKLEKAWAKLHAGDCEPYPDEADLAASIKAARLKLDPAEAATTLQEAWRAFHAGDFQQAFELGESLGVLGASVAVKAGGIHGSHLLDSDAAKLKRYEQLVTLAEAAVEALPKRANSYAGSRRQGQGEPGCHPQARTQACRGAHSARAVPRRDHQQGRQHARRPDLWRQSSDR